MRNLRIATNALLIAGMALLVSFPLIVARRPLGKTATRHDKTVFAAWFTTYTMALLLIFFAVVICAYFIVRKQRQIFREESMNNLKELIEGTLKDHEKKQ